MEMLVGVEEAIAELGRAFQSRLSIPVPACCRMATAGKTIQDQFSSPKSLLEFDVSISIGSRYI